MHNIDNLFFDLIRVSIGTQDTLSRTPYAGEWQTLYDIAKKQSLVGICFAGVQKLSSASYENENLSDSSNRSNLSELLYLKWMGMAAKIQQRNEAVNRQCVELQKRIEGDGFRTYIMKGQGNSVLYRASYENENLSMLRQSGDIDIYLEGGLDKVLAYARTFGEVTKVNELEMSVSVYKDTKVEFHYRPFIMRNPFKNRKLQKYFCECMDRNFSNSLPLDWKNNLVINVPSLEFNLVHQMVHIYHHLFTEGIGLRQLMDYYFLLRSVENVVSVKESKECIHSLGLDRFAAALMWVIKTVFVGHDNDDDIDNFFPWEPNGKDGMLLLDEIMLSGNFGKQDGRMEGLYDSKWNSFWMVNTKTFRFWRFDHWAWFWSPVWRIWHYTWKKNKGF